MKTLKELLEVAHPKPKGEKRFKEKHVTIRHKDRNGNDDKHFKASNIKPTERMKERHGYDHEQGVSVYEDTDLEDMTEEQLDEVADHIISEMWGEAVPSSASPEKLDRFVVKTYQSNRKALISAAKDLLKLAGMTASAPRYKSDVTWITSLASQVSSISNTLIHRKMYSEDVDHDYSEDVDHDTAELLPEAVRVDHSRYKRSHGRTPRGGGLWVFTAHEDGLDPQHHAEGRDHISVRANSFSDAKKQSQRWAAGQGHDRIYTCEEAEEPGYVLSESLENFHRDAVIFLESVDSDRTFDFKEGSSTIIKPSHAKILLRTFAGLEEENQANFLERLFESLDSYQELLDFSITNEE